VAPVAPIRAYLNRQLRRGPKFQVNPLKPAVRGRIGSPIRLTAVIVIGQPRTRFRALLLLLDISTSDQHGDFMRKEREPVSTLDTSRGTQQMADHTPSLYLDRMRLFTSILIHTADLSHHSEITLQDVPKLRYTLRLLVDNEERELQRIDNRTWEPAQRLYVPLCL